MNKYEMLTILTATLTDEEKAVRAEKRKDKEISKAQALLAALMNSVEA